MTTEQLRELAANKTDGRETYMQWLERELLLAWKMRDAAQAESNRQLMLQRAGANAWMELVREFHERFGVAHYDRSPAIRTHELRANLIEEEARETVEAIRAGDIFEACDGMADLLYVIFGTALAFGVDLWPIFREVHRSNMTKEGTLRDDGKILKGNTFEPPDIAKQLRAQGWNG